MTDQFRLDWERWGPQLPTGALILLLGVLDDVAIRGSLQPGFLLLCLGLGSAVALSRRLPNVALASAWLSGVVQLLCGIGVSPVELSLVLVAYGCARWGAPSTVWLSGVSIPSGALVAVGYLDGDPSQGLGLLDAPFYGLAIRYPGPTLAFGLATIALLALPWLAGLAVRALVRAQRSEVGELDAQKRAAQAEVDAGQAQEIARLRDEQARLARDVHDVVGHSLAVILAQAESAQYLPDDPGQLKRTMATIAGSARSSLQDVRHVLAGPGHPLPPARTDAFEQMLDGVRAGGHEVVATEVGAPQPLPPELDVVAHRVVQEMLTNAIKHGRRGSPVLVERHWPEGGYERDLRIEVRNVEDLPVLDETQPLAAVDAAGQAPPGQAPPGQAPPGQGLDGMRRRLDSVGGRLDVRRRAEAEGPTFTATAWVPVSGR